jgi:hypothetical protein
LAQRLAPLPIGVRVDEIVESFGFGEIELAVLEGAPGKFTGLGRTNIFERGQRREQSGQHRTPAMDVKFRDVFPGRAGRTRKPQHHRIIDRPLAYIMEQRTGRHSRRRQSAGQRRHDLAGLWTRDAHQGNRARWPARRQCKDGLIPRMHGLFVREGLKRQRDFDSEPELTGDPADLVPIGTAEMLQNPKKRPPRIPRSKEVI